MGELIDGAMQQAAQCGRQAIVDVLLMMRRLSASLGAGTVTCPQPSR
jgi:hypothetical protein